MKLRVEHTDAGIPRVILTGRMDVFGIQEIDLQFNTEVLGPQKSAILDLSELEYLSSVGVRTFLSAARVLQASGSRMVLLNPQPMVEKTLRITGTDQVLPIETTLEAAIQRLQE